MKRSAFNNPTFGRSIYLPPVFSMPMDVTLLGTGSAFPSGRRVQSGTVIERGESRVLVDCGSGVLHRLGQHEQLSFLDIDTVLLTHLHLDHVSDLAGLFKARILKGEPDLTIIGPPGTETACIHLFAVDDLIERGNPSIVERTVEDAPLSLQGFQIRIAEGTHSQRSHAYRFDDAVTLSGDTTVNTDVLSLADGSYALVHECSYPDGVDTETHTTPAALAAGIEELDIERLYLTHLFPEAEPEAAMMAEQIAESTAATVRVATDLAQFAIPD